MHETNFPYPPFELSKDELRELTTRYASNPVFLDNEELEVEDNPYRRQLRPQAMKYVDFSEPLSRSDILNYSSFAASRMLTSIYEADFMFLPKADFEKKWEDFKNFYSSTNRVLGEMIRPHLERHVYGFLDDEVEVTGRWTRDSLEAYLRELQKHRESQPSKSELAILNSADPQRAAKMWLIQLIPDFLSEASPMIRNVMGYYGPVQSEWFKIIIDEYGYGVHNTKHSTLYERTLESVGLSADLHHYWQFYLSSSLLVNNYFNYLGKNHELFFRYLGALYYTESALVDYCERAADMLRQVFGEQVDVQYFTEHTHIDKHHGRMALETLILPVVDACGDHVIPEIIRGFQEFQLLAEINEEDVATQIQWVDSASKYKKLHDPVWAGLQAGKVDAPVAHLDEHHHLLSNTHCHDGDELCHIVSGTMKYINGFDAYTILEAGEGTVIRKNRLHGADIVSDNCVYEIHSIGDYEKCL